MHRSVDHCFGKQLALGSLNVLEGLCLPKLRSKSLREWSGSVFMCFQLSLPGCETDAWLTLFTTLTVINFLYHKLTDA